MISKYILSLGMEMEGGLNTDEMKMVNRWLQNCDLKQKYTSWSSDGSISGIRKDYSDVELKFWHTDLKVINSFLECLYKSGFETNKTCGFHIHIILDKDLYSLFSYHRFYRMFIILYKQQFSGRIKYILRLSNNYCKEGYSVTRVMSQLGSPYHNSCRYNAINLNCYKKQGTIEFRILPNQESSMEAISTLKWFITTIEFICDSIKGKNQQIFKREIPYTKYHNVDLTDITIEKVKLGGN